jgi:DNA-binding transcriptional LysR family regulator
MREVHSRGVDSDALRAFVVTVREGSFSAAAAALGLSQPAVSRRIARLEAALGTPLLERRRPAVTPTRQGLRVLEFAEGVLAGWDALRRELADGRGVRGTLRVASSTAPGIQLVPRLLARFAADHPEVQTSLHVMNSETAEECVRARHCDVGFVGHRPRVPTLSAVEVAEDAVVLAVPAGHRLARAPAPALADLAGETLIARERGSGTREAVERALAASALSLPPHRMGLEVDSAQTLAAAVAAGHGVGFVSALALAGLGRHDVVAVRLRDFAVTRPVLLIYDGRHLGPAAATFVPFVRETVRPRRQPPGPV